MTIEIFEIIKISLFFTLIPLILSAVVGVSLSILQAVIQINDPSLLHIIRIGSVVITLVLIWIRYEKIIIEKWQGILMSSSTI